jgi:hypothetical protein
MAVKPRFVVDRFGLKLKLAHLHFAHVQLAFGKRKPRKPLDPEPAPVKPDRPLTLSGGAAAELEFD